MMVGVTDQDTEDLSPIDRPDPSTAAPKRRVDKTLLIVSLLVGLGLTLVARGVLVAITGDERANLPELIEEVDPVPDSTQVVSQSNVFVDLASGYTGVLVIDGIEIETVDVGAIASVDIEPGQQVDLPSVTIFEPGNSTLTFAPGENAVITEFTEGEHRAEVIYWKVGESRQRSRSFTWTFRVV